ncbi:uncharacterized protein si:dkey-273o13.3 [Centropristis striata]|uniref:uncharacterized protein si:dkey-273o13.3 n=1 Tax=Centropristis striata TaxID=184440 RepID=UPI0027E14F71|nr:uncharacterized protein si:dkey-273o13.3 [Centropristis striata]
MDTRAQQFTITMETTTMNLIIIVMETTTVQTIVMEITTAKLITIAMKTTTVQTITIIMETSTIQTIVMKTTTVQTITITMETTTVKPIPIAMGTTTVQMIVMETTTVQTITITMETTTVQPITITMETTTVQTIVMETTTVQTITITMETTTAKLITISMETTTVHPDNHHHHGDHHSETHHHHHGDHHGDHHRTDNLHGDHQSPENHHHHGDHHSKTHHHHHGDHHSPDNHHGDHNCPDNRHRDHHSPDHQHPPDFFSQPLSQNNDPSVFSDLEDHSTHSKQHSAGGQLEAVSNRSTVAPSSQDEERTSFSGPSLHKEKTHDLGRIMKLQEQNQGLHQSLLKTAVRMECLGEEFMSSQKLLEAELQRTRMELSNITEKFRRLHDNCSTTQQTNSLLEQRFHSVAQTMEGERERLKRHISALTEQLADAKFANSVETFNVTSVLHKTDLYIQSDDAMNQVVPPITPPPAEFMDNHNYEKAKGGGQEQSLGSVPEEEESDWSEMGDETPRFILTGSNRGQVWRHREPDVDKDSESGGEEIVRQHSPRPLQIPHLQFTLHNENLSDGMTGEGTYRITTSPNLGSAILIRSASLEEIPLARHHMQKELRGTEAMMDLHHRGAETIVDLDNEIIHHWRISNDRDAAIVRPTESRMSEADSSLTGLQSAEQMLNHIISGPQQSEGQGQGRAEVHGWTGGIPDEVLKGERTQL